MVYRIALDVTYVIVFSYQKYYHKFLCLNKNVINAIIFNSCKYIRLPEFEISNDTDLDDPSVLVTSKAVYQMRRKTSPFREEDIRQYVKCRNTYSGGRAGRVSLWSGKGSSAHAEAGTHLWYDSLESLPIGIPRL